MAYFGSQTNDEFSAGVAHQVNPARSNLGSITLGGDLQAASGQAAVTPHSVLATTVGGGSQDDGSWERYERGAGSYQPGQMPEMTDQLDQGSDNTA
jgi:hypothetical protein